MILIPILAAAAIATFEPPPPASTASPSDAAKAAVDSDPVVCRNERGTGTQFSHKVCLKKSEWARMGEAARQIGAKVQGGSSASTLPN